MIAKAVVFGMIEQKGRVKAWHVNNAKYCTLGEKALTNIKQDAIIVTDEFSSYDMLGRFFSQHHRVNHSAGNYSANGFHNNSIESFWATLKRGRYGIYHQVSKKHLQMYVDEFCFRHNNKGSDMFNTLLQKTILRKSEFELYAN